MAGSRSQVNKAHKSRFASKASRHAHRTSGSDKNRIAKPDCRNSVKGGRAARVQRSKMARDQKRAALLKERRTQGGSLSSPRVIVLFGLSSCVNLNLFSRDLLLLLSGGEADGTSNTVSMPGCKLRATVYTAPYGDILSCMELCKVADLVAFVVSSNSFIEGCEAGNPIDAFGTQCLSVFRAIGLPSTAVFIQDLPNDVKKKQDLKKTIISYLASEVPEECKFYLADTKEELHKFMWLFKEQHLSAPHWRNQRSYLMCQQVDLEPDDSNPGQCTLLMSGYVRVRSLSVNQLVHVSGAGDFQLSKIDVLKDPFPINDKKDHNAMDSDDKIGLQVIHTLLPDPLSQEPLLVENAPDPLAGEQTWPTEAEIAEADENRNNHKLKKKKLPRGTSYYQAAWIVDDTDDEVSDDADGGDGMVLDEQQKDHAVLDGSDYSDVDEGSHGMVEETEAGEEMDDDEKLTKEQVEAEIKKIKDANAEDEEFPDEVDTPLDVPAKKRFAKYRGLKSFRTSSWDPKESLPPEYARIFAFDNFTRTQKHVLAKLKDEGNTNDYASVGSFVRLHVKNVPVDVASKAYVQSQKLPVVAYSLLEHESKMSVLHFSVKKHDSYEEPIKSKDTLIFHVGFRKFLARPVFSSDNINCEKHKMERFLHEGCFSIASVYAPVCYPPLPLIVMRCASGEAPTVVATGSLKSVDPDRIVLKKIILTGYPQRVSKLKAIVRFMFHNPEDVRWFKPVDVWTKLGRRGRIKEPVGTHGAMKCVFNGVIQQHDTVCMSLYKRSYPKWPERLYAV